MTINRQGRIWPVLSANKQITHINLTAALGNTKNCKSPAKQAMLSRYTLCSGLPPANCPKNVISYRPNKSRHKPASLYIQMFLSKNEHEACNFAGDVNVNHHYLVELLVEYIYKNPSGNSIFCVIFLLA